MTIQQSRDLIKEVNQGIEDLGKEVLELRKENKELRKICGLQKIEVPLILTEDKEIKDGHE
jgi:cell shape-determining protein MreC